MANFQVKNNTANKIEVCGETIEGSATNTIAVSTLYKIPNADQRLADLHNDGTVDIILPAYTAQRYSIAETNALNWLYNTFARALAATTTGELHLYADSINGDDNYDGLSANTPKKTLTAVCDLIPSIIEHNVIVHLTGTFTLSSGLNLAFILAHGYLIIDGGDNWTDVGGGIKTTTGSSVSSLVVSGAGWTTDQWAGYCIRILSGDAEGQWVQCQGNTTDTITPSRNFTVDPGIGATFDIVRPTTEITGSTWFSLSVQRLDRFSFAYLQRLYVTLSSAVTLYYGAGVSGGFMSTSTVSFYQTNYACWRGWIYDQYGSDPRTVGVDATKQPSPCFFGGVMFESCNDIYCYGGYITGGSPSLKIVGCLYGLLHYGIRIKGQMALYNTMGLQISTWTGYAIPRLGNATGVGLIIRECPTITLKGPDISNCGSHAIEVRTSGLYISSAPSGSNNTGAGVYAHSSSTVLLGVQPTVTGTVGDFSTDGSSEKSTWAAIWGGTPAVESTTDIVVARKL